MTDTGLRVLRVLAAADRWMTLPQVVHLATRCRRKTSAALLGCRAGGLVQARGEPVQYRITDQGRAALSRCA